MDKQKAQLIEKINNHMQIVMELVEVANPEIFGVVYAAGIKLHGASCDCSTIAIGDFGLTTKAIREIGEALIKKANLIDAGLPVPFVPS